MIKFIENINFLYQLSDVILHLVLVYDLDSNFNALVLYIVRLEYSAELSST